VGTEGGALASAMLQSCDLLLGVSPIASRVDLETEGVLVFELSDSPVEIDVDETKSFTVRCDVAPQAAEGYVGLAIAAETAGTPGVTAESSVTTGLEVLDEYIQGLPINGDGKTVASTIINIINGQAYPVVSLVANNEDLQPGDSTYVRFSIAAANEPVAVKQLTFMIEHDLAGTATLTTTTGSSLRPSTGGANLAGTAAFVRSMPASALPSCEMTGDWYCVLVVTLSNEIVVTPGEARTYDLRLSATGDFGGNDDVRTSLMSDFEAEDGQLTEPTPGYGYGIGVVVDSFLWSDLSAGSHNDDLAPAGSSDWFNGYDVFGLPSDSQVLMAP
jgi:hypothetical protein